MLGRWWLLLWHTNASLYDLYSILVQYRYYQVKWTSSSQRGIMVDLTLNTITNTRRTKKKTNQYKQRWNDRDSETNEREGGKRKLFLLGSMIYL